MAPTTEAGAARVEGEARKVLTILFADISGSTRLGQTLDPESLRRLMSRYFAEMRVVIERHEGVVAKFIGDAVMAVFGVPRVHEDDALRAVRTATEMRDALTRLNAEFEPSWGVTMKVRTGVNTGEVIAGEPGQDQTFVVGDAVNLAARLEQFAEPGEILIGQDTHRLVRNAVVAERVGPLELKGIAEPVPAWRLLDVVPDVPGWSRTLDSQLVGRDGELAELQAVFRGSAEACECRVVTLIGPAGVGKSRLTRELLSRLGGEPTVIRGRCLPYGEGITFWPVAAILRDAADVGDRDSPATVRSKLSALLPGGEQGELVAERLGVLLGIESSTPGIQETFWAVRKLLEHLAAQAPLVVVFDDIHWGEPTFLDLLEYLADWIRDAPVLIVCLGRPELHDARPGWTTGKHNATLISLPPLSDPETEGLIRNLVHGEELPDEARARIAEVAEGNPLFVEEALRMLVDDGVLRPVDGRWTVIRKLSRLSIPQTILALLTARLDRLEAEERTVIEAASVIGRTFWWGAVSELAPQDMRPRVAAHMQSLMRKELIRPDFSELRGEDAFRFSHILIRDAAYRSIPKSTRAEMHEQLADWIADKMRKRPDEYEEIVGYHLEQAYLAVRDLGPPTERVEALGARAAAPLAAAGERSFVHGDMPAAVNLLSRATALLPERAARRLELLPELAFALMEIGDFDRLQNVTAETKDAAKATADRRLQAHAIVLELWIRLFTNPEGWADEAEQEATSAIEAFRDAGDERGLAKGWSLLGLVHLVKIRFARAEQAWKKAAAYAHRAGDRRDELESMSWVPLTVWAGPIHVDEGLRRCREAFERVRGDKKAMSSALMSQAVFFAGLGRFDEARELIGRARAFLEEVALPVWLAGPLAQFAAWIELLAGDARAAERELRPAYKTLAEIGEAAWLPTVIGMLAEAVYLQGRYDEAEQLTRATENASGSEDVFSHVLWRSVRAKVLARRGLFSEGERLAREMAALAEETDFLHLRWHALQSQAEVLLLAGRTEDVGPLLNRATSFAERKGNLVAARLSRSLVERVAD
jgi:class 3 adenylate cyclase/tetratricopeptide (TPR) repeat protein